MVNLTANDSRQYRGHVKITDGSQVLELDSYGNIVESTLDSSNEVSGGQRYIFVNDQETTIILNDILKELKKTNFYLSIMTDTTIKNTESEV